MKKIFIVIIIIVIALAAALVAANAWYAQKYESVDASEIKVSPIVVADQGLLPVSGEFTVPVFGGNQGRYMAILDILRDMLNEDFEKALSCVPEDGRWVTVPEGEEPAEPGMGTDMGLLGEAPFDLEFILPDVMHWSVTLKYIDSTGNERPVYMQGAGMPEAPLGLTDNVVIRKAGDYVFLAEGILESNSPEEPSGTVLYRGQFSIKNPDPLFAAGRTELAQGEIFSLRLENILEGIVPELESGLGPAVFTRGLPFEGEERLQPEGFASWYAAIPVSNTRAPGDYPVNVTAGDLVFDTEVTVVEYEFDFQNMIIDTSIPSVASAVTGQAIAEFREKVIPLFSVFSEERYWEGMFAWPIEMGPEDFISTEFGEIRITNGDYSTKRFHNGVDIAASTGTPVLATAAGRVLLAEFLLNTGWTVVLDHGGGLISIYYHMDSIATDPGLVMERGELIGRVGTTGYSTGPHLHFEMRIGDQPVNPTLLLEQSAGLYSAK